MRTPTEYPQFGYELGPACGVQSHQNRAATPLRTWRRWSAFVAGQVLPEGFNFPDSWSAPPVACALLYRK